MLFLCYQGEHKVLVEYQDRNLYSSKEMENESHQQIDNMAKELLLPKFQITRERDSTYILSYKSSIQGITEFKNLKFEEVSKFITSLGNNPLNQIIVRILCPHTSKL